MQQNTPFLTGFPTNLFGSSKRSTQEVLAEKRHALIEGTLDVQQQFLEEIDPHFLESYSTTKRVRNYPNLLTFWTFLIQVSSEDASCAAAVAQVQGWAGKKGLPVPASGTSSYCEARAALPVEMLRAVNDSLYQQLDATLSGERHWRGLRPRAEDGTSAQMPDTVSNRQAYPYPSGQQEGCGFPMVRLNGLIDLSHGGLCEFAKSPMQTGEISNHNSLAKHLHKGDVFIADRLYSSYEFIAHLRDKDVHFIGRTHHARKIDFRKGKKLSANERLVTWKKPRQPPVGKRLYQDQWKSLREEIQVRIIRCAGPDREGKTRTRYLVTTLLDNTLYPAVEVGSLYFHRWEIEVSFRDIKSTLGMNMLRTKSPKMIEKELLMYQIVYNLMRLIMLKAGMAHRVNHRRLSFRGAQQAIHACRELFQKMASRPVLRLQQRMQMWARIAERIVLERPGRNEPRRVKRRPKCTRWLQKPRHQYFEHFRSENPPMKILDQTP